MTVLDFILVEKCFKGFVNKTKEDVGEACTGEGVRWRVSRGLGLDTAAGNTQCKQFSSRSVYFTN